jgi:hypothetical protein
MIKHAVIPIDKLRTLINECVLYLSRFLNAILR